jgi:Transposase IS4
MTSKGNTHNKGTCIRRSQDGLIEIERPELIGDYNKYMGGVDLADMRRLHCNSTIMEQHCWWLKLFFYLLDVGTANALVLYREAMNNETTNKTTTKITIVEFKAKLVNMLVGNKISKPVVLEPTVHEMIRTHRRHICTYCALFSKVTRTRYKCIVPSCDLALCGVSNGRSESDCFAKAHATKEMHQACLEKKQAMKLRTNKRGK